jgi:hypothetical protein
MVGALFALAGAAVGGVFLRTRTAAAGQALESVVSEAA